MRHRCGFNLITNAGLAIMLSVMVFACAPVKYVPKDSYLLNKVKVKTDNQELNRDELNACLRQRDNTRILGFFRFHLWLYNLSSKSKPDSWLKRAGEPPQIYSEVLAGQSAGQIRQYLHNKGYYLARVGQQSSIHRNKNKIEVEFDIESGEAYKIDEISYHISDSVMDRLFRQEFKPRYLRENSVFDLDLLDMERERVVEFYKNRGYFYFSKPLIYFEADTSRLPSMADLKMYKRIPQATVLDSGKIFQTYRLGDFTFNVMHGIQSEKSDTVNRGNTTYIFPGFMQYKPALFERVNKMSSDSLYNFSQTQSTFNALNRLRQFRLININFQERERGNDSTVLDCTIDLSPLSKQSTSFDIEGTNTSGNFGIAGNLNYAHKNLFKGAEILNLRLKGAMERQQAIVSNQSLDFNTREMGVEATLSVPKLIGPGSLFPSFGNILPKTLFTLAYNYQRRPDYTRTISTMKLGYEWMTSEISHHNWNIVDFNMVNLSSFDPEFLNSIYDLYIKESFTDHLILASGYTYMFNTQALKTRENYTYMRFSAESSGNLLNLASKLTGANKVTARDTSGLTLQSYYKFLDTRYAQYVRGDVEFRKGYWLDKYNSVVGRVFLGVGLPYGNFDVLPFEKKYFTGGANGIRAWQVRSLGPGTYRAPEGSYPNQSGDIKLEANIEYRYKLIRFLDGAFFLDAGNVWAINEKDNRPGAQFKPGQFYKQLALGTGTGFRFDFDYFIFRLDLGLKMRDPAQVANGGWIIGTRKLVGSDFNLSFAIGYPF